MTKKILVVTDMDSVGSGYKHICVPLFTELMKLEDYEIKIIGFMYHGEEHNHPFSVIPAITIEEAAQMAINLLQLWFPDVVLVAMDLPIQVRLQKEFAPFMNRFPQENEQGIVTPRKYIAIAPLENDPLVIDWATALIDMGGVFFISQLATDAAHEAGVVKAEHLVIGCDTESMRPATSEEKQKFREGLGIPQDAFVVLTVADNQERKNLGFGMKAIAKLKNVSTRPVKYLLVTREHNPYGMKLRAEATRLGINQELVIFERGMPTKDLWALYAVADAYLQPSKAEGLGLPVLDAMLCKVPVVATDTGAMTELLQKLRGWLVQGYEFEDGNGFFVDVWGNSKRVMMNIDVAASCLVEISKQPELVLEVTDRAYEYVAARTWDKTAKQLHNKIKELTDGKKTKA